VIVVEYETWFVAAAGSLGDYLDLRGDLAGPDHPEAQGRGARWIEERFKRGTYVKPRDQPRMTRAMDLNAYRERSPSFERLCQKLGKYVR
jgi:hypothetical protein